MMLAKYFLILCVSIAFVSVAFGEDAGPSVEGTVMDIADDGSYIMIGDTKVLVTKDFLEDSYLEIGDNVVVNTKNGDNGIELVSFHYAFDDMEDDPFYQDATDEQIWEEDAAPQGYIMEE